MPEDERSVPERRQFVTKIASAYLRRHQLDASQLDTLISTIDEALQSLGTTPEPTLIPAIPVRQSATRKQVICLDCGWRGKALRRHLGARHGLTPAAYRARWHLPPEHPLVAREYVERRSALAKQAGLGQRRAPAPAAPSGSEATIATGRPRRRARSRPAPE